MLVVMNAHGTDEQIEKVCEYKRKLGSPLIQFQG